jgi:hypothetical protein
MAIDQGRVHPVGESPMISGERGLLARATRGESIIGIYEVTTPGRRSRLYEFRSEPLVDGTTPRGGIVTIRALEPADLRRRSPRIRPAAAWVPESPAAVSLARGGLCRCRLEERDDGRLRLRRPSG